MSRTIKSRKIEVLAEKNVKRYASYVRMDKDSLNELAKAYKEGDEGKMFEILKATGDPNVSNLMETYLDLVVETTKKVLDANASRLDDDGKRQARLGEFKPTIPEPKPIRKATTVQISQSYKGKTYNRAKPTKFTKREQTYIKSNYSMSNKELVTTYNAYFPNRSSSSIITKKYRLKGRKSNKYKEVSSLSSHD